MSRNHREEKICTNCGNDIDDKFCSYCGQENLELKEPFWNFIFHSIGHYFHFDSKFFLTIKPLLTKPGQLSIDYIAGKRIRFIHPVSLFLFISLVYFLIGPLFQSKDWQPSLIAENTEQTADTSLIFHNEKQDSLTSAKKDNFLVKQFKKIKTLSNRSYEGEFSWVKAYQKHESKTYFILMPFFAFLLMLNFRKNKKYYMEHLIFTIHLQSFYFLFSLLLSFLLFLNPFDIVDKIISTIGLLFILWYIYTAIKLFYQREKWVVIRKMIGLLFLYFLAAALSIVIITSLIFMVY
ncbi:MAG: DUF3667 domain-containing protein [Daejeonella sp.]